MEVLGGVASAITVGVVILEISSKLKKLIKDVRHARREIKHLTEEMGTFAKLYECFFDAYKEQSASDAGFRSAAKCLISWARNAILDFKLLHDNVCALAGDPEYSPLETVVAHIKWYFSKTTVKYLRASLVVARESMMGITNIRAIQKLDEQLRRLRLALTQEQKQAIEKEFGMPVEQYIRYVEERKRSRRKQRHENAKCLKEAKKEVAVLTEKKNQDEFVPRSHQLYDLTKSVDIYVEEVLPMRESGKRARVSRQPQTIRPEPEMTSSEPTSSEPTAQSTIISSRESGPSMNESATSPEASSTATAPLSDYLNYCSRCKGTCIRTEAHGTMVPPTLGSDTGAVLVVGGDDDEEEEDDDDDDDDGVQEPSDDEAASETDGDTNTKRNSVFQPVAGVKGRHPRGWPQRHERSESPQEFWHRKIP